MDWMQNGWVFLSGVGILGLLVGSFLNVAILRIPKMIQAEDEGQPYTLFNLWRPRSHCPYCKHLIPFYYNIPLWSYLQLKGRCDKCKHKISLQYPLVEGASALLSVCVALQYGFSMATLAGLLLVWVLITLSVIDIHHKLLPDTLTLPCLWLGLFFNTYQTFASPASAILGALCGYLSLWSVYWVFKWITGKEGMGYGDFKLMALMGAWFGWQSLLFILFFSSMLGALFGIGLILFKGKDRHTAIPFGPFIAAAGLITLYFQNMIPVYYFQVLSLG